jgi:F-type H+-transporting ATPase subunit c
MRILKNTAMVSSFLLVTLPAFAQEAAAAAPAAGYNYTFIGLAALAAGLAIGLGVLGAAGGQGKAAASALEGISRNPSASGSMFVPLILSLVFMESLCILAFLIAFFLNGSITSVLTKAFSL